MFVEIFNTGEEWTAVTRREAKQIKEQIAWWEKKRDQFIANDEPNEAHKASYKAAELYSQLPSEFR